MAKTIFQELIFSTTLHFQLDRAHRHSRGKKYQMQSHYPKHPKPPPAVPRDDHLQEAISSGWSISRGRPLRMIICKRRDPWDNHLQEAGSSWWSFARGRILRLIICKWSVPLDDHLEEAGPSEWSTTTTTTGATEGHQDDKGDGTGGHKGEKEEKKKEKENCCGRVDGRAWKAL